MAGIDMQKCDCTARCGDDPGIKTGKVTPCRHYRALSAPEGEAAGAGEAVAWEAWDELVSMFCGATDNLGDMPISDEWAARWAKKAHELLKANDYFRAPQAPKESAQALTEDEAIGLVRIASTDNMYMFGNFIGAEFSRAAALALVRSVEAWHGIPAPAQMNDDKQEGAA